jgi:hypothetical protein
MMYGPEKSDPVVIAGKPTNKAERSAAELVEPRTRSRAYRWLRSCPAPITAPMNSRRSISLAS